MPLRPTVAYRESVGKGENCALRHPRSGRWRVWPAALVVLALAGCAGTSDPDDPANRLLFSPDATASASAGATAEPTSAATLPPFPQNCDDLVSASDMVAIVGTGLPGRTTFVFAAAQADIERVGRVTCGYGVRGDRDPAVEVTVNDYEDADAAAARVDVTLDAAAESGDQVESVSVGGYEGWVLSDRDSATLVVRVDARTVVITLQRGLVPRAAEPVVLAQIGEQVLGVPPGEPTPVASPSPTDGA
jgi:hypothetical protein